LKFEARPGVPRFDCEEFHPRRSKYALCIPIINEGSRIIRELERAVAAGIPDLVDIAICDGGSTDGCTDHSVLEKLGVNSLLTKMDKGKQGAQLRMGFRWCLDRGYDGILTIDGNDKDSIDSVPLFISKLEEGYDFVQGSRFLPGGAAVNTPLIRHLAVMALHAPILSLAARHRYTDTTNAFRAHSRRYLEHPDVQPFRDIFQSYELLAYLSVRATRIGMRVCEVPVRREYPLHGKVPTKIGFFKGNWNLLRILFKTLFGRYNPRESHHGV
jgi:dolichol-phosphate mannosyltransferase